MQKTKVKNTTSKKKRGGYKKATGVKVFHRKYPGQDPLIHIRPQAREDIEKVLPPPDDVAAKHKYPPPKKHPVFRKKWMRFINNVVKRENFNIAHLDSLEILCDLYVEYDELQEFVRVNGRSYCSLGRAGETWRLYPETMELSKCQSQIKEYTKMLGLLLKKDHGKESGGEEEEWA